MIFGMMESQKSLLRRIATFTAGLVDRRVLQIPGHWVAQTLPTARFAERNGDWPDEMSDQNWRKPTEEELEAAQAKASCACAAVRWELEGGASCLS